MTCLSLLVLALVTHCLFPRVLEAGRFKIKVPADLVLGKNSFPGLQTATFLLYIHIIERALKSVLARALISSWGPPLMTSYKPNYIPRLHLQIPSHEDLGLQHTTSRGGQKHSVHNKVQMLYKQKRLEDYEDTNVYRMLAMCQAI